MTLRFGVLCGSSPATVHIQRQGDSVARGRPLRGEKAREAILQVLEPRPHCRDSRKLNALMLQRLQAVREHRTVVLRQYGFANVHEEVGCDAENVHVVRRVVDLAERDAVGHLGDAAYVAVFQDVCGVEQGIVSEPTHRASLSVGGEHELAKFALVESLLDGNRVIAALDREDGFDERERIVN